VKAYAEHEKMGKKAIFFVITDDTRNWVDVTDYLEGLMLVTTLSMWMKRASGSISRKHSGSCLMGSKNTNFNFLQVYQICCIRKKSSPR